MFTFSNCSEPSQVIFTDWQGRRALKLSAETSHVSLTVVHMLSTSLHIQFQGQSLNKAKNRAQQNLLPASQQQQGRLPEHKQQPWKQSLPCTAEGETTSKTVLAWAWGSPLCTLSKPGTVTLNTGAQGITPRHLQQKCFGTQTSSHSATFYFLWFLSPQEKAKQANKPYLSLQKPESTLEHVWPVEHQGETPFWYL